MIVTTKRRADSVNVNADLTFEFILARPIRDHVDAEIEGAIAYHRMDDSGDIGEFLIEQGYSDKEAGDMLTEIMDLLDEKEKKVGGWRYSIHYNLPKPVWVEVEYDRDEWEKPRKYWEGEGIEGDILNPCDGIENPCDGIENPCDGIENPRFRPYDDPLLVREEEDEPKPRRRSRGARLSGETHKEPEERRARWQQSKKYFMDFKEVNHGCEIGTCPVCGGQTTIDPSFSGFMMRGMDCGDVFYTRDWEELNPNPRLDPECARKWRINNPEDKDGTYITPVVCMYCHKTMRGPDPEEDELVSHGICDECYEEHHGDE